MAGGAATAGPSGAVVRAFGLGGEPRPVPGGEARSFLVGRAVLKRVHDVAEAAWVQELLARVVPVGVRIARPIEGAEGGWVVNGWIASEWIPHLRPAAPSWNDIIAAGLRFADAAERVRSDGAALERRSHRWAVADRVAWDEAKVELSPEAADVVERLRALFSEASAERHFVHGDLTGNVFFDSGGTAVVLDVSPYLRPRRWAAAIVVADAVLWAGAPPQLARDFARNAADRDLLGRALSYRLVAEQLAVDPRHGALLDPYHTILAELTDTRP